MAVDYPGLLSLLNSKGKALSDFSPGQQKVLSVLFKYGAQDRETIIENSEMKRTTVYDALDYFIGLGLVRKFSPHENNPHENKVMGRPKVYFRLLGEGEEVTLETLLSELGPKNISVLRKLAWGSKTVRELYTIPGVGHSLLNGLITLELIAYHPARGKSNSYCYKLAKKKR